MAHFVKVPLFRRPALSWGLLVPSYPLNGNTSSPVVPVLVFVRGLSDISWDGHEEKGMARASTWQSLFSRFLREDRVGVAGMPDFGWNDVQDTNPNESALENLPEFSPVFLLLVWSAIASAQSSMPAQNMFQTSHALLHLKTTPDFHIISEHVWPQSPN